MRDIKFRAWTGEDMLYEGWNKDFFVTKEIVFRFDIVMQFTGLKDNNGNEIYHKDIFVLSDRVCVVEWERDRWVVQFKDYNVSLFDFIFNDKGRTVSGNIYENPDLLK